MIDVMGFLCHARCTVRTNELDVSVIRMTLDRYPPRAHANPKGSFSP